MKVIGEGQGGLYLCEVSHGELEKLVEKYYGKLGRLQIGSEMNLGAGYDFRSEIAGACRNMITASERFGGAQKMLMKFAVMVAQLPDAQVETKAAAA